MSESDLIKAVSEIGKSPCEMGCPKYVLCKDERMACLAYANYIIDGVYSMDATVRRPSKEMYDAIMHDTGKQKESILPEEDVVVIRELKRERARLLKIHDETKRHLKGLTDRQLAEKFDTTVAIIKRVEA